MRVLIALLAGSLFGMGLTVSGMTDTSKVQGWLDIFGAWDPTLAFVLGGAILPMLGAWAFANRRATALLGTPIPAPSEPVIDRRLVIGSALFGTGWALAGLCPGPAMAVLGHGGWPALAFFGAMVAGMIAQPHIPIRVPANAA